MSDFAKYLETRLTSHPATFKPGLYDETSRKVWTPSAQRINVDEALIEAEKRLAISLPPDYKTFMSMVGPGIWADTALPHPDSLYAFDAEMDGMAGMVAVACNVDQTGNYVAFEPTRERHGEHVIPVWYCSHDPFGKAKAASSFSEWICTIADIRDKNKKNNALREFYLGLPNFIELG